MIQKDRSLAKQAMLYNKALLNYKERNLKILHIDIENSPNEGFTWGTWEQNVIEVLIPAHLLCVAWNWEGESKIHVRSLRMYPTFKVDKRDDFLLTKEIHDLFMQADVIVAHNAKKHDIPFMNWRFLVHKMKAPSPYKVVDTLQVRRGLVRGKAPGNSLNYISLEQGYGAKVKHDGFPLWKACIEGKLPAYKKMETYNKKDIVLLKKAYTDLRGWMPNHPKSFSGAMCETCDSNKVYFRGPTRSKKRTGRRFQCQNCGAWGILWDSKN